jgi:hypothetical protein
MKLTLIVGLTFSFFSAGLKAQEPVDPFNWTKPIHLNSSDIFILWSEGPDAGSLKTFQKVYTYEIDSAGAPVENRIAALGKDSSDIDISGNKKLFLASGNLNADEFDDVIAIWEREDQNIEVLIAQFDTSEAFWRTPVTLTVNGPVIASSGEQGRIFVRTGDFDADSTDEFLVAYLGTDLTIHILLYDTDGTLVPNLVDEINDEDLSGVAAGKIRFDIATGDFDNDGSDEIVLTSYNPVAALPADRGLFAKIYDVSENTILPKAREVIIPSPSYSISGFELAVTDVPFYATDKDEIAVALTYQHNESPNDDDTFLQFAKISTNLESFTYDVSKRESDYKNPNSITPVLLSSGDLNNDGKSELVYAIGDNFSVYTPDSLLNLNKKASGAIPGNGDENSALQYSYEYLAIDDIDQTEGDEIVVVRNIFSTDWENPFLQHFDLSVYGAADNELNALVLKAKFNDEETVPYEWPNRNYALALGNFDASKVIIEKPNYYRLTNINQPLVILNTPPVHFDIFDDTVYDVNNCYTTGDCEFSAEYIKSVSQTHAISTEVKASWDVTGGIMIKGSKGVEASAEPFGVGVAASIDFEFEEHFLSKYGQHLENTVTNTETVSIQVDVTASEDDQIFATFTNYDVWKYPYREGNSAGIAGSIYVFKPLQSEGRWYPSKSASGNNYRPKHEIGNILSYSQYGTQSNNPDVFEDIYNPASSITYTLNSGTNYLWTYTKEEFDETTALNAIESSLDVKHQGFAYFQYEKNNAFVYTHTTSLTDEISLSIDLGKINRSFGETEYRITPYVYWSKQGALVIDYSVEPDLDGNSSTWWQEKYGDKPDPTFILPWKYDPEKGFGITDEEKRKLTRDIILDPVSPKSGDTVLITVYIRNFSLMDTDNPVKAKFYLNNPDNGGVLLQNLNGGGPEVSTNGYIPSRDFKIVEFKWVVPSGISNNDRVYVVLDPDNEISEIHENNNIGWAPLKQENGGNTTAIETPGLFGGEHNFSLGQNYPNPFNGTTLIPYTVANKENIRVWVYTMSGILVKTYDEGLKEPGKYVLSMDGNILEPGVYIYTIQGISGTQYRKMTVIH